jgi:hypothetical protein
MAISRPRGVGENAAERFNDRLEVKWSPSEAFVTVESSEDQPVESSSFAAYVIPGGRYLVFKALYHFGDEGEQGGTIRVVSCDRIDRVCH